MPPATANAVIEKIDNLLHEKDSNLNTRTGLRFMTTVLKEGLQVVGEVAAKHESITVRLGHVEDALNQFLQAQERKEKRAEEERGKWRWVTLSAIIGVIVSQVAQWILR